LRVPVRDGLACIVLGSSNASIGLVGMVLGIPIRIELAIVVMQSRGATVILGVPVRGVLAYVVLGFPTGVGILISSWESPSLPGVRYHWALVLVLGILGRGGLSSIVLE